LIRTNLDGKKATVAQCIQFGLLAGLIGESVELLTDIVEDVIAFSANVSPSPDTAQPLVHLLESLSVSLINTLSTVLSMAVVLLSVRVLYRRKRQVWGILLLSALAPATEILWDRVAAPLLIALVYGRFMDQLDRTVDVASLGLSQLITWLVGACITVACLLGFRLGLRVAFWDSFPLAPTKQQ
jgi:hypothetical protein